MNFKPLIYLDVPRENIQMAAIVDHVLLLETTMVF